MYLMISGTAQDESQTLSAAVMNDPELKVLQEQFDINQAKYAKYKQRHQDPESDVYQNQWFEKKFVAPAWAETVAAQQAVSAKRTELLTTQSNPHITNLKILYRLGLVLLCMVFAHGFFRGTFTGKGLVGESDAD